MHGGSVRIVIDAALSSRAGLSDGGAVATVHLCADPDCTICPEQTADRVRAEIEAQAVLADAADVIDWQGIAAAVNEVTPVLDAALLQRMMPELGQSFGVPADMAETGTVWPAPAGPPDGPAVGATALLAPTAGTGRHRDTDRAAAGAGAVLPPPERPQPAQADPAGMPASPGPRAAQGGGARARALHVWARAGVLAAAVFAGGAVAYPTAVRVVPPLAPFVPATTADGQHPDAADGGRATAGGLSAGEEDAAGGRQPAPTVAQPIPRGGTGRPGPAAAVYFPSCAAADLAHASPIHRGAPGYRAELDADGDGTACESDAGPAADRTPAPASSPAAGRPGQSPAPGSPAAKPEPAVVTTTPAVEIAPPSAPPDPQPTLDPTTPPTAPEPTGEDTSQDCTAEAVDTCVLTG
jgi:hypothetical protein